jgi:hypothetical protein
VTFGVYAGERRRETVYELPSQKTYNLLRPRDIERGTAD